MGNGVSTDQGNLPPHGTRDVRQSEDEEQHNWSQLAEAPNTNSALLVNRKTYIYIAHLVIKITSNAPPIQFLTLALYKFIYLLTYLHTSSG